MQVQELKGEFHDDACQHLCPRVCGLSLAAGTCSAAVQDRPEVLGSNSPRIWSSSKDAPGGEVDVPL